MALCENRKVKEKQEGGTSADLLLSNKEFCQNEHLNSVQLHRRYLAWCFQASLLAAMGVSCPLLMVVMVEIPPVFHLLVNG